MEKIALLISLAVLVCVQGYIVWSFNKLRRDYVGLFGSTLKSLVQEWNKVTQTINALVFTLPEGGKDDTGHLTASEEAESHPAGMSASKRALYAQNRGKTNEPVKWNRQGR